jgi:hypothetical protein
MQGLLTTPDRAFAYRIEPERTTWLKLITRVGPHEQTHRSLLDQDTAHDLAYTL